MGNIYVRNDIISYQSENEQSGFCSFYSLFNRSGMIIVLYFTNERHIGF